MHTARIVASFILLLAVSRVSAGLERSSRGITAEKASRLATMFIHVTGCGSVEAPIARGAHWEVPLRAGVVGARAGSLRVDSDRSGILPLAREVVPDAFAQTTRGRRAAFDVAPAKARTR
jgi:hypothetical protein